MGQWESLLPFSSFFTLLISSSSMYMLFWCSGSVSEKVLPLNYLESEGFWRILHLAIIIVSLLLTVFVWLDDFIGLSYNGLCGITLTRKPRLNIALPSLSLVFAVFFTILGIFTYFYFQKHIPKSEGFQRRKYSESKIIGMYVVVFSLVLILTTAFSLVTNINC